MFPTRNYCLAAAVRESKAATDRRSKQMLKPLAADAAAARQNVKRNVNVETNLANKLIASTKKTFSTNKAFF